MALSKPIVYNTKLFLNDVVIDLMVKKTARSINPYALQTQFLQYS